MRDCVLSWLEIVLNRLLCKYDYAHWQLYWVCYTPCLTSSWATSSSGHCCSNQWCAAITWQDFASIAQPYLCLHRAVWGWNGVSRCQVLWRKVRQRSRKGMLECVEGLAAIFNKVVNEDLAGETELLKSPKGVREWALGEEPSEHRKQGRTSALAAWLEWSWEPRKPVFLEESQRGRKARDKLQDNGPRCTDPQGPLWRWWLMLWWDRSSMESLQQRKQSDVVGVETRLENVWATVEAETSVRKFIAIIQSRGNGSFVKCRSNRCRKMRWDSGYI